MIWSKTSALIAVGETDGYEKQIHSGLCCSASFSDLEMKHKNECSHKTNP